MISETEWTERFDKAKANVKKDMQGLDTAKILITLFNRLYTLRNQIFHGGSTYASQVNRNQLQDACNILKDLLPTTLNIMHARTGVNRFILWLSKTSKK